VAVLCVVSLAEGSGKTAICAGLAQHLLEDGKKAGFLKPVRPGKQATLTEGIDGDAELMKHLLSLPDAPQDLCPAVGDDAAVTQVIKEAYDRASRGKDVLLIEGDDSPDNITQSIAEAADAKVLIVTGPEESPGEALTAAARLFGKRLLGVVLNKVPVSQVQRVRSQAVPAFSAGGVEVLGVLPEDRALSSITVGALAEGIRGEIRNNSDKSAELAENYMLGAMTPDSGLLYFGRKDKKVAIVRGERADMQLAVLQTPTRALVLSGGHDVLPQIAGQAEQKGIPIIAAEDKVADIVTTIEGLLARARFSAAKLPAISRAMEGHLDFAAIYRGLGLVA